MSTILDALKKSEQERKLANLPELSSMPLPEEEHDARRMWWGLAVLAISVIAIIIYLILNLNNEGQNSAMATSVQANQTSDEQMPAHQASVRQLTAPSYVVGSKVYNYNDLSGSVREIADSLNINVVSYTEDKAKCFVMIDSGLYRIGHILNLQDGTEIEVRDIEANAVILKSQEIQFRLAP